MTGGTVSSEWLRLIVASLAEEGIDSVALCSQSGINYENLGSPSVRFSRIQMEKLWNNAVRISNKASIGLNIASQGLMRCLKPAVYTFLSSPSLKQGFSRVLPFQHVISDYTNVHVTPVQEGYKVSLSRSPNIESDNSDWADAPHYAAVDAALGSLVNIARWVSLKSINPMKIYFRHDLKGEVKEYQKVFRCPIEFGSDKDAIIFAKSDFEAVIPTADEGLTEYFQRVMADDLERAQMLDVKEFVESEILKNLPNGTPSIDLVASKLFMTARTLQRRLKAEGVAYKNMLDNCRKKLAAEYLCERKYTIEKTALELGFSEVSTFTRAFKRWFNQTPGEYRKTA